MIIKEPVDYLTYGLMGLDPASQLGGAVNFFIYDTVKIFLLLSLMIFAISYIRSYIPPQKAKEWLSRMSEYVGNVLAALFGIVTPFCSCSAVPLFIGFVESGIPLGVTFSFLIASPMINEIAVIMLFGLFGWQVTALYIGSGLLVAILGGILIGRLKLEGKVEGYVYDVLNKKKANVACACGPAVEIEEPTQKERLRYAWDYVVEILKKVSPYVVAAIGLGALIHGYVPTDFLAQVAGKGNPLGMLVAVIIGVPLYSNAAGVLPLVSVLMEKGVPLGTALAFMMAVTALSLPEMIILRKVLKPKLLGIFIGILTVSIIAV